MNLSLREKVIVVINGSSGIGEAVSSRLALEEAYPVVVGPSEERNLYLLETFRATGGFGVHFVADTAAVQVYEQAAAFALQTFGRIDGAVLTLAPDIDQIAHYQHFISAFQELVNQTDGQLLTIAPQVFNETATHHQLVAMPAQAEPAAHVAALLLSKRLKGIQPQRILL